MSAAWLYFIAENADGTPRLIVRRSRAGSSCGPMIELLGRDGWIDRPQLLTRFHDPGFLEPVTFEEALTAAEAAGVLMPP